MVIWVERLNVGVIGVGNMGKNHVRIYSQLPHLVKLIGVYDPDPTCGTAVESQYQIKAFPTPEELLSNVDAVSVVVPTSLHHAFTVKCLKAGAHVLVEKPIAASIEQAEQMIAYAKAKSRVLLVGHVERYNPAIQELKKILADEEPIALSFLRLSPYDARIQDTDVVLDLMIHDLDILLFLLDSPLRVIQALGVHVHSNELVDYAAAQCLTDKKQLVTLTASRITEKRVRKLLISTSSSFVEVDYIERKICINRRTNISSYLSGKDLSYRQESLVETVLVPNIEPLLAEILDFITSIQRKVTPQVDGSAGLAAFRLGLEIQNQINCNAN